MMNAAGKSEPSVGELLGTLASETATLVRQEIHLASTEMHQKSRTAAMEAGVVGMGGALAHAGVLALIFALVLALGAFIPMWISALVIGVVAAGGGAMLVFRGLKALRAVDPVPRKTVQTLRQDEVWMKEQLR